MILQDNINNKLRLCFCLLIMFSCDILFSQENGNTIFNEKLFEEDSILELTLNLDLKQFKRSKKDKEYSNAILKYQIGEKSIIDTVRIKPRGIFRNNHCAFPPYLLNIKKSVHWDNNDDYPHSKYKVVTMCNNSKLYSNYLLKEYLVYKLYNIITDYSFRVRLLKIVYIDEGRRMKEILNWAILIEPEKAMSNRLKAYPIKIDKLNYSQTETFNTTLMSFFQYMIGNTDYSISGRHNIKLLTLQDHKKPGIIPIAYDFDFSGFVSAYYAKPQPGLGIEKTTDRLYYGMCRDDEVYYRVIKYYKEKKEEIFELISTFDHIESKTTKELLDFIQEFYQEIEMDDFIDSRIRISCDN